ncbi:MAG: hypothetical protein Q8S18_07450 [Bacteroidales bacterium]|nr:hypothetical protein [Bacteroidales bacterium]
MDFNQKYQETLDELKLKFLEVLLRNGPALQDEFIAFVNSETGSDEGFAYDSFLKTIVETQEFYKTLFESVDLENPDWDNYVQSGTGRYVEEWEAYQMASEQEFDSIFEQFMTDATKTLIAQRPDKLLSVCVGIFIAAETANIDDPVSSFYDVNEYLLQQHQSIFRLIVEKAQRHLLSDKMINAAIALFFRYCNETFTSTNDFIRNFEPLLLSLAEKQADTQPLIGLMQQYNINAVHLPQFTMFLYKKSGNDALWLQQAIKLYKGSKEVAEDLLKFYFQSDQQAFVATARELFPDDNNHWARFLKNYITAQLDEDLFVQVYTELIKYERNIENYQRVKHLLGKTAYDSLINQLQHDQPFIAQIYADDGRYDDIKDIVEKHGQRHNLDKLIAPVLEVYPAYCMGKIALMIEKTLAAERGRHVYEYIVLWLQLARQIPGQQTEAAFLITTTYNHKPNLPALKDEMRKAGLV